MAMNPEQFEQGQAPLHEGAKTWEEQKARIKAGESPAEVMAPKVETPADVAEPVEKVETPEPAAPEVPVEAPKEPVVEGQDEPETPYVNLDKHKKVVEAKREAERAAAEKDAIIQQLTEDLNNAKSKIPASEKERILNEFASKTENPEGFKEMVKILKETIGPESATVEQFNAWQKEQAKTKALEEAKVSREKRLNTEFETKPFKDFLNVRGVTKPEDVQKLKAELVREATTLPDGIKLSEVYFARQLFTKYEKGITVKGIPEASKGGVSGEQPVKKAVKDMNAAEWEAHKKEHMSGDGWNLQRKTASGRNESITV